MGEEDFEGFFVGLGEGGLEDGGAGEGEGGVCLEEERDEGGMGVRDCCGKHFVGVWWK